MEKKKKGRHKDREMRIHDRMVSSQQDQQGPMVNQDQVLCKRQNRVTRNSCDQVRKFQRYQAKMISHTQGVINGQDRAALMREEEDQIRINGRQEEEEEENPVVKEFQAAVDAILEATSGVDLAEVMGSYLTNSLGLVFYVYR